MPVPRSPDDLLATELKEIHSAERQLSRAVPKLLRRVRSDGLKRMLEQRRDQGARLIEELDNIFDELEVTKARPKNVAAEGLLEDMNEHLEEIRDERFLDPVLLAAIQKLEHYCIAARGTAASMGRLLERQQVVRTMERVLEEGKRFDEEMTRLAEEQVNPAMLESGQQEDGEEKDGRGKGEQQKGRAGGKR